jgi:hypothetical protein
MKKVLCLLLAFGFAATTAFAQEGGGLKAGFYGSIASSGVSNLSGISAEVLAGALPVVLPTGQLGLLVNLGSLEISLGFGYNSFSTTDETVTPNNPTTKEETSVSVWEVIPGISYTIRQLQSIPIGYGVGVDVHLGSYSMDVTSSGKTTTIKPESINMAFFPNFKIQSEIVKNFKIGLKTGLMIVLPADEKDESSLPSVTTTSKTLMGTRTEVGFSFYL